MNPAAAGTISPSSAFFSSGASVQVGATANSSSHFSGFTGALSGGHDTPEREHEWAGRRHRELHLDAGLHREFERECESESADDQCRGWKRRPIVVGAVGGFAGPVTVSVSGLPGNYFGFSRAQLIPIGILYLKWRLLEHVKNICK
jgi:hypothetical protein